MVELRVGRTSGNTLDRWRGTVFYQQGDLGGCESTRAVPLKFVARLLGRRLYDETTARYGSAS